MTVKVALQLASAPVVYCLSDFSSSCLLTAPLLQIKKGGEAGGIRTLSSIYDGAFFEDT